MLKLFGLNSEHWVESSRNDLPARKLADRHYSRKTIGARDFVGPGELLILVGEKRLWVSRFCLYRLDGLDGVECSIFRNESNILSSSLILEAAELTKKKWPDKIIFTYVNPEKICSSNPGYCFKMAGFKFTRRNKSGKLHLLIKEEEGQ